MTLYVNNEAIHPALVEAEVNNLRPAYQQVFQDQPEQQQEQQLAAWARENIIEAVLFRQEARKAFPDIPQAEIENALSQLLERESPTGVLHQRLEAGADEVRKVHEEMADQLRRRRLQDRITGKLPRPSEKEIRNYYEQHLAERFTIPEMVHAAHIVKHPSAETSKQEQYEQMQQARQKLDSGVDFSELVKEYSDCPENGGSLGFFARGKMVRAFEEVVFALDTGACSGIFETEFGLHIAKVIEKRSSLPCPLEQVREVIVRELTQQAAEKALEQFLDAQKEKARIEDR